MAVVASTDFPAGVEITVAGALGSAVSGTISQDSLALHSDEEFNCLVFDGRCVTRVAIAAGEPLSVNFNQFHAEAPLMADGSKSKIPGFLHLADRDKDALFAFATDDVKAAAVAEGFTPMPVGNLSVVADESGSLQATARHSFASRAVIATCRGLAVPFPLARTIALTNDAHLLYGGPGQYLAHSCDPNVRIFVQPNDWSFDVIALRPILDGEPLSYNFLTTEWEMSEPFDCQCGAATCFKKIEGFNCLHPEGQESLVCLVSPAILEQMQAPLKPVTPSRPAQQYVASPVHCHEGKFDSFVRGDVVVGGVEGLEFDVSEKESFVSAAGRKFRHSESPSLVLVEGRLIAMHAITPATELTLDLNLLAYKLPAPLGGFAALPRARQDEVMLLTEPALRAEAAADGFIVVSQSPLVTVRVNGGMGQAAFATKDVDAGVTLFEGCGELVVPFATMYTICTGDGRHTLFGHAAECIAHSCDPNTRIVVTDEQGGKFNFETVRPVKADELLSFNYLSTEWEMRESFPCLCGSPKCFGRVHGLQNVPLSRLQDVAPLASPAVLRKIAAAISQNS